jgi:hypothetical protein
MVLTSKGTDLTWINISLIQSKYSPYRNLAYNSNSNPNSNPNPNPNPNPNSNPNPNKL